MPQARSKSVPSSFRIWLFLGLMAASAFGAGTSETVLYNFESGASGSILTQASFSIAKEISTELRVRAAIARTVVWVQAAEQYSCWQLRREALQHGHTTSFIASKVNPRTMVRVPKAISCSTVREPSTAQQPAVENMAMVPFSS